MDTNLFSKIEKLIKEKTGEKTELIHFIKEVVGLEIKEEQIEIKGKKLFLYLNSTQKMIFSKNKGEEKIKEKGFTI